MVNLEEASDFLKGEAIQKIKSLDAEAKPSFGIMTPQHMVEHLSGLFKFSTMSTGEAPAEPTEKQIGMKNFIHSDSPFPKSDGSNSKLADLRFTSLEEAKEKYEKATAAFFKFYEEQPDAETYNDFFGKLKYEDHVMLHYKHVRHHLAQFGVL